MNKKIFTVLILIFIVAAATIYFVNNEPVQNNDVENEVAGWKTYTNEKYGFELKYPQTSILEIMEDTSEAFVLHINNFPKVNPKTVSTSLSFEILNKWQKCGGNIGEEKINLNGMEYYTYDGFTFGVLVGNKTPHFSRNFIAERADKCIVAFVGAWWLEDDVKSSVRSSEVMQFDPNFDPDIETKVGMQILESLKFTQAH